MLGTINVGSMQEAAFTQDDVDLLAQIGNEAAIAIENAMAYRQIGALKDKLAEEKLYLEDEIRTEYDFEEIVGESPVWKRVLQRSGDGGADRFLGADPRRERHRARNWWRAPSIT